ALHLAARGGRRHRQRAAAESRRADRRCRDHPEGGPHRRAALHERSARARPLRLGGARVLAALRRARHLEEPLPDGAGDRGRPEPGLEPAHGAFLRADRCAVARRARRAPRHRGARGALRPLRARRDALVRAAVSLDVRRRLQSELRHRLGRPGRERPAARHLLGRDREPEPPAGARSAGAALPGGRADPARRLDLGDRAVLSRRVAGGFLGGGSEARVGSRPLAPSEEVMSLASVEGVELSEIFGGAPLTVVFADGEALAAVREGDAERIPLEPPFHVSDEDVYLVLPADIGLELIDIFADGDAELLAEAMSEGLVVLGSVEQEGRGKVVLDVEEALTPRALLDGGLA